MKYHFRRIALLSVFLLLSCHIKGEQESKQPPPVVSRPPVSKPSDNKVIPTVELWLSKPVSLVKGGQWPVIGAKRSHMWEFKEDHNVVVHWGRSKVFRSFSKGTTMWEKAANVDSVWIMPQDRPTPIDKSIEVARKVAHRLPITKMYPNGHVLEDWHQGIYVAMNNEITARCDLEGEASLFLQIRRYHDTDQWFLTVYLDHIGGK